MLIPSKRRRHTTGAVALAAVLALATPFTSAAPVLAADSGPVTSFDAKQRADIEKIVRDYLIANPDILVEVSSALQKRQEVAAEEAQKDVIKAQSDTLLNSKNQVVLGNPQGDVTLVEFFDYNCGYCRRAVEDTFALIDQDPKLRVVLKEFPILTEGSVEAARVAIAVKDVAPDRYAEFHRAMFAMKGQADGKRALQVAEKLGIDGSKLEAAMKGPDVEDTLQETHNLAQLLQISGTPSYVIGDAVLPGAVGVAALKERIDTVRKCGGTSSC
ncbi:Protein-disulfide isomerase [Pseudoxanthobacter soli DSM 19599]|uniref:Protein-disulfide isomerase n=1 Tax=Pseudoxanthobacter soli DSM 19599 TaxID=1123029 RepID=A0A1M7Z8Y5_9HYPH|nr:DsbA family protein [Pseudoxanthobacter soli]SHO61381.1 Protein-disulfide isomerase [Pseudoxanthobacter soli DSM 19599]